MVNDDEEVYMYAEIGKNVFLGAFIYIGDIR